MSRELSMDAEMKRAVVEATDQLRAMKSYVADQEAVITDLRRELAIARVERDQARAYARDEIRLREIRERQESK